MARAIAGNAPLALQGIKTVIQRALSFREQIAADLDALIERTRRSADARERRACLVRETSTGSLGNTKPVGTRARPPEPPNTPPATAPAIGRRRGGPHTADAAPGAARASPRRTVRADRRGRTARGVLPQAERVCAHQRTMPNSSIYRKRAPARQRNGAVPVSMRSLTVIGPPWPRARSVPSPARRPGAAPAASRTCPSSSCSSRTRG